MATNATTDEINSLDDANHAALDNDKALRIQPPAPGATLYYYHDGRTWRLQKCGHSTSRPVDVEKVRRAVKLAIPKNDQSGGGGVRAVDKSRKDKYA